MAEDDALAKLSVMTSEEKAVKDIIDAEELITSDDSISSKGTEAGMHRFSKNWGDDYLSMIAMIIYLSRKLFFKCEEILMAQEFYEVYLVGVVKKKYEVG